jgi:sucrose phosphorylase
MRLNNGVMLITYANSLGKNLSELGYVLDHFFEGAIDGVHILPFYPSSSDRGFSPTRYDVVNPEFGHWPDLAALSTKYYLMYDFMINHLSSQSRQYQDFLARHDQSAYAGMFIRYSKFWSGGEPTDHELARIYKRKPRAPYVSANFLDGSLEKIWCTFGDDQIDLDLRSSVTWEFIHHNLLSLAEHGAAIIRLDAFAYAVKKAGGSCFFEEPEIWDLLKRVENILESGQVAILPEMHEHYSIQMKLSQKGYWVYDFALPMLLLHALYTGETAALTHWLQICPRRQFTTLDTHDGIGVVDVRGLLMDQQVEETRELLFKQGANVKRIYNSEAYHNLDIYQINCTYYSALGDDDKAYILARAVQIFAPGIPQVYYVGLLAGKNDIELVESTQNGRDINRHSFTVEEIAREIERPVVLQLIRLLRFRNTCPAFAGDCAVSSVKSEITIRRSSAGNTAELKADFKNHTLTIQYSGPDGIIRQLDL